MNMETLNFKYKSNGKSWVPEWENKIKCHKKESYEKHCVLKHTPDSNNQSVISITLTSPDGKNQNLFKKEKSLKKSRLKGIPRSEFWLPSVKLIPSELTGKDPITVPNDGYTKEKTEDNLEKIFEEALGCHAFRFVENKKEILNVCKTIDEKWIAVSLKNVFCFQPKTSTFCCISIEQIASVWVDFDYLAICLELVPDSEIIEVIPGEAVKTESLITSIMFASSRFYTINSPNHEKILNLRTKPLIEMPLCNSPTISKYFIGEIVTFSAIAYYETVESQSDITNEIMMKIGSKSYEPVDVFLIGNTIRLKATCLDPEVTGGNYLIDKDFEILMDKSSIISRSEIPRPHTVVIKSKLSIPLVNLSASNATTAYELTWRLRSMKESSEVIPKQLVYVIVTKDSISLFSISKSKKLLLQSLVLNVLSVGQPDTFSCLIANDGQEVSESTNGKNVWWKLSFLNNSQCNTFFKILESCVDSNNGTNDN